MLLFVREALYETKTLNSIFMTAFCRHTKIMIFNANNIQIPRIFGKLGRVVTHGKMNELNEFGFGYTR